jgi:hypothetical protein
MIQLYSTLALSSEVTVFLRMSPAKVHVRELTSRCCSQCRQDYSPHRGGRYRRPHDPLLLPAHSHQAQFCNKLEIIFREVSLSCEDTAATKNEDGFYQKKIRGLSPRANYTDGATVACRRSYCQRLPIEGAKWSA